MQVRSILVPVDFSRSSDAAFGQAIDLARGFGAKLHLLHSFAIPMRGVMPYEFVVPEGVWDGIREAAEEKIEALREKAAAEGVEVTAEVSAELPAEAIVAASQATFVMACVFKNGVPSAL